MIENSALIIFVKNPVAGKVKSRLAADIGDEAALIVYKNLLNHTLEVTIPVNVDKFIFYSDFIDNDDIWPNEHYQKFLQDGIDLGEKMKNSLSLMLDLWYEHSIIIGSDCYEISTAIIESAFHSLQSNECIIGPAEDGGYYLIGMNEILDVFDGIDWSTVKVLDQTISKLNSISKKYTLLEKLRDIDDVEDLKKFRELIKQKESTRKN